LQAPTPPSALGLVDRKGRVATKLRVSVTDRCNFACLFCMPEKDKIQWIKQSEILDFPEIHRVVSVLAGLGVNRVRITGGEPLLRSHVELLVKDLVGIDGIHSVDMTTNGWFLEEKASLLKESGLRGVTVSLHSLRKDRFEKISGANAFERVLRGIDRAIEVGLSPVKLNSVAIKGYNDDEIPALVEFARSKGVALRFIEFMPLDGRDVWTPEMMMSGKEILQRVSESYTLTPLGRGKGETSSSWGLDGRGELGLITPMSEPFCDDCDRIRLTSDGKLLSCLFDVEYHDLRHLLHDGASDQEIADAIRKAVWKKPDGVGYMPWVKEGWEKPRNMNAIGG
jgi:cyclic pyranopterin phosphate synthase